MRSFAILCLVAAALAAPTPANPATPAANPKALPSGKPAAAAAAGNCAAAQAKLMQGIQSNLDIQKQELAGVRSLQAQSGTPQFQTTQKSVIGIQQKGIAVRAQNQKLASQIKSPSAAGLATVAGAQTMELNQVMGLKGTQTDANTLNMLVQEVQDGTKQNQKNLAAAQGQKCAAK